MSDKEALLAAIVAHPAEDTPRLAYADWLDEHARGDADRARAEFIRLQLAEDHAPGIDEARGSRIEELLTQHKIQWLEEDTGLRFDANGPGAYYQGKRIYHLSHENFQYISGFLSEIGIDTNEFNMFGTTVMQHNPIHRVRLSYPFSKHTSEISVVDALKTPQFAEVQYLDLSNCDIDDNVMGEIALIPHLNDVRTLILQHNFINRQALRRLAEMKMTKLTDLDLFSARLNDDAVAYLATDPAFKSVKRLQLDGMHSISVNGMQTLGQSPLMAQLETLDVGSRLTDQGLGHLLATPHPKLQTLGMSDTMLGENGLRLLAHATTLPNLTRLEVRGMTHRVLEDPAAIDELATTPLLDKVEHLILPHMILGPFMHTLATTWFNSNKDPCGLRTSFFALKTLNGQPLNDIARNYGIHWDLEDVPPAGEKLQQQLQRRYCQEHGLSTAEGRA